MEAPIADGSLQEEWFPDGSCFGCGPANQDGLGLRSFAAGDEVVAEWRPHPRYGALTNVVAGGVVGTLLDCHAGAAVFRAVGDRDGRVPYVGADPWVTVSYTIDLLRPTPVDRTLHLRAHVTELDGDEAHVVGAIEVGGTPTATISAVFRRLQPRV